MPQPPRLIVNADDLGAHPLVNEGIKEAVCSGIVTSATLIVSAPYAEDAIQSVVRPLDLPIGLHLCLTHGRPLSPPDQVANLVDDDTGEFRLGAGYFFRTRRPDETTIRQIRTELSAQFAWVADRGLPLTHVDSHQHIHMAPWLFAEIQTLARRFGIQRCRMTREPVLNFALWHRPMAVLRRRNPVKWAALRLAGRRLRTDLKTPDAFLGIMYSGIMGVAELLRHLRALRTGLTYELSIHPALPIPADHPAAHMRGMRPFLTSSARHEELKAVTASAVKEYIQQHRIQLINYSHLG